MAPLRSSSARKSQKLQDFGELDRPPAGMAVHSEAGAVHRDKELRRRIRRYPASFRTCCRPTFGKSVTLAPHGLVWV